MDQDIQISLNYLGHDYIITVPDLETANILLNEPEQAELYMKDYLCNDEPTTSRGINVASTSGTQQLIWNGKKPTERDTMATEYFLKLRDKYSYKFDDKKTIKSQIWLKIAEEMNSEGYYVGQGKEAIEKLRLKFSNLQKQYLAHIRHMKTTGERQKDPPPFFEFMHNILGQKDKVNPSNTQDTFMDIGSESSSSHTEETCNTRIKNRFSSENKSVKPKSANTQLIEVLKEQHELDRKERQEHFKSIENLLQTQNGQRDRLLNQFEKFVELQSRKRKYSDAD